MSHLLTCSGHSLLVTDDYKGYRFLPNGEIAASSLSSKKVQDLIESGWMQETNKNIRGKKEWDLFKRFGWKAFEEVKEAQSLKHIQDMFDAGATYSILKNEKDMLTLVDMLGMQVEMMKCDFLPVRNGYKFVI